MDTGRIFIIYATVVGLIVGGVIVLYPQSRDFTVAPYFWILIAFGVFELVAFARSSNGGPPITGTTRIISFAIALVLMVVIPMAAGMPMKIF